MPSKTRDFHKKMLACSDKLTIRDHGAGSRVTGADRRKVSSIARHSSVSRKYGELLYRLSAWYTPKTILELGTGIGISTAYLGAGYPETDFYSVEGSKEKTDFVKMQFQGSALGEVNFIYSKFEDCLGAVLPKVVSPALVFIDGDHRYEPTVNTVQQILNFQLEELIIILDDIHWSNEMEGAWNMLCQDARIDISVNLFFMGFLICRPGIEKQHFNITF